MRFVIQSNAGDFAPTEIMTLTRADGSIINLLGATVWLLIRDPDSRRITNNPPKNNQCTILNAVGGVVSYDWNPNGTDLPNPGVYKATLKVKYSNGSVESLNGDIVADDPLAFIS